MSDLGKLVQPDLVMNQPPRRGKVKFNKKDTILYALGLGCKGQDNHKFIYELHPEFTALPTMPVVWNNNPSDIKMFGQARPAKGGNGKKKISGTEWGMFGPGIPKFNFALLLHGEQYVELSRPGGLPVEGSFTTETSNIGLHDKGKGLLLENETIYRDDAGNEVCKTVGASYVRTITGFKSVGRSFSQIFARPTREPDHVVDMYIDPFQAEFYRVNGDYNPLHIDHSVATSVGFPAPILHGLCTFGTACRAVLQAYTNGDPKTFKAIKVRFASPVYPGTTLRTEMWDDENNTENAKNGFHRVMFETKMKGEGGKKDVVVLSSSYVDFFTSGAAKM